MVGLCLSSYFACLCLCCRVKPHKVLLDIALPCTTETQSQTSPIYVIFIFIIFILYVLFIFTKYVLHNMKKINEMN